MKPLISKLDRILGSELRDYQSGLLKAELADLVLGYIVSSSFERIAGHRKRQAKLQKILEAALTSEELAHLGPIVTMTPAEASITEKAA